jgi:hypothetical protein
MAITLTPLALYELVHIAVCLALPASHETSIMAPAGPLFVCGDPSGRTSAQQDRTQTALTLAQSWLRVPESSIEPTVWPVPCENGIGSGK